MSFLSIILFLPTFLIMGGLFVLFPRTPRHSRRTLFDAIALTLALAISVFAMRWGYLYADPASSLIWRQVLATLLAYAAFLASLVAAMLARAVLLRPAPQ